MCIIADPPIFAPMLNPKDPEHGDFSPIFHWVMNGHGKFVIGGEQYTQELSRISGVLSVIVQLERMGKIIRTKKDVTDNEVVLVKTIKPVIDFDDPHLVALVRLTGCRVVCLRDRRAHRHLKDATLYRAPGARPKLYTCAKNKYLLSKRYVPRAYL